ncbi:MAG: MerR family DNA-binding protein [Verrucomicrobia bacterium]|nr:MerR family DNA-binding protein [Verrucomicrobiota bacterium]MDA1068511.1 MerR family DNA-binding protein [Verrucomicrobiota bacterium]
MTQEPLTMGQVANRSGIGIETVRFYERQGLIKDPPRSGSGYRMYPEETVTRIQFTRRAKDLGFSLKEIKDLLSLSVSPGATCQDIKHRAEAKLTDIEDKIRTLRRMKKALAKVTAACRGEGSVSDCPILEAMEQGKELAK